jgi:outer membrane protein assembly factor BamB
LHVYKVDLQTGQEAWRFRIRGDLRALPALVSSPVITHGNVIFGAGDSYVYALSEADGSERWRIKTDWIVNSSPAVAGDVVYFGSDDGHVYALEAQSGELLWRLFLGGQVVASPVIADGSVYVGSTNRNFFAVR